MKSVKPKRGLKAVLLPDIRSAYNIGSIFRTCDAAGVDTVYLSGHSPCPVDRFDRPRKDIAKTALGAEKTIPWHYEKSAIKIINKLKGEAFYVVAIEQTKDSIYYKDKNLLKKICRNSKENIKNVGTPKNILFIFGNEVTGIDKKILKIADVCVEVPMRGDKESLNVSVTAGIVLFGMLGL